MQLFCKKNERGHLGLSTPNGKEGVLISTDGHGQAGLPHAIWIEDPQQITQLREQDLLAADQIWARAELSAQLQAAGVPRFKISDCQSKEAFSQLAEDLYSRYHNRDPKQQIVWRGPWGSNGSLAYCNSMFAEQLDRLGWTVHPRSNKEAQSPIKAPGVNQNWPPIFLPASRGPSAGLIPWEFIYFPREWMSKAARSYDQLWVPSEYVRQGAILSGFPEDWVHVTYSGVDLDLYQPNGPKMHIPEKAQHETVFLFVGGTIHRKGLDLLQAAWDLAWGPDEPVRLIIKSFGDSTFYQNSSQLTELQSWAKSPKHAPVTIISQDLPIEKLPDLYRAADVGVFPYRGEGFGLPILESMACGLPVIVPDHGPSNEYCLMGGWRTQAEVQEYGDRSGPFRLTGPNTMHQVSVEELAHNMRLAAQADNRLEKREHALREAQAWSWQKGALQIQELLREMQGQAPIVRCSPLRPQGNRYILAIKPPWASRGWGEQLAQVLQDAEGLEFSFAIWAPGSPEDHTQQLIEELQKAGLDTEQIDADLLVAHSSDWRELALGCDAILQLWQDQEAPVGQLSLRPEQYMQWQQAIESWRDEQSAPTLI